MDTIIKIGGREAVPVRALPWMTDWHFGAQDVAESLAHLADPAFLDVHSFRLEGSELVKVLAESWRETFLPDVESIENLALPGDEYKERVTRSLPEGVFVWLDEWSAAYERCPDGPGALRILLDDEEPHGELGLTPEDRSDLERRLIVRSPRIPSGLAEAVLSGSPRESTPDAEDQEPLLKRRALIEKYRRQWKSIERDLKDAGENGLSAAAKSDKHGYWFELRAVAWARKNGKYLDPANTAQRQNTWHG